MMRSRCLWILLFFAFDFDLDTALSGYLKYAKHTEHLHWHLVEVNRSYLPAFETGKMAEKLFGQSSNMKLVYFNYLRNPAS